MIYQEATCIEELLLQYKETLKRTNESIAALKTMIEPYKKIYEDKNVSKAARIDAKENAKEFLHELSIYNGIRNELEFAIHWMSTGHQPGNRRGIERRAAYEKEKPIDPLLMQRYYRSTEPVFSWDEEKPMENVITPSEKQVISKALSVLTEKELEVYLMARGNAFSQYKIANLLNVSRNTIKTMIKRADKKIAEILSTMEENE